VILPKLYCGLAEYLEVGGPVPGFYGFLEAKTKEITTILTVCLTHFGTMVEVDGDTMRMMEPPKI
jgi:hypothetical protein